MKLQKNLRQPCAWRTHVSFRQYSWLWQKHRSPGNYASKTCMLCQRSTGNDNKKSDGVSSNFSRHPTMVLRDVMRQFYLSFDARELLDTVQSAKPFLDTPTSLHLLSHVADLSLKDQLEGKDDELVQLVSGIISTIPGKVHELQIPEIGCILWTVSVVPSVAKTTWGFELLSDIAFHELKNKDKIKRYNTRELANILSASGKIMKTKTPSETNQGTNSKVINIREYNQCIVGELVRRMDAPNVRGAFSGPDFADIVGACDVIFSVETINGRHSAGEGSVPVEVERLLDVVAFTLRRHLANKHSLRNLIHVDDMSRLLASYASLKCYSEDANGMLDATANWISSRLEHQPGVSFAQLAELLEPYATLQHNSVSIPEMIQKGICMQIRRNAIALHEHNQMESQEKQPISVLTIFNEPRWTRLKSLVNILECTLSMGYAIDEMTLNALMPAMIIYAAPYAEEHELSRLLQLFERMRYDPGPLTKEALEMFRKDNSENVECM